MTIGDVWTRVVLDEPTQVHCGSESAVSGTIVVEFKSKISSVQELFGPMNITIYLEGRAKSKIRVKNGNNMATYHRGRAALLAVKATIHSGAIRFDTHRPQSFPFSISFPEVVQDLPRDRFNPDVRFKVTPSAALPPSMACYYPGGFHKPFECFVEYRIRPEVLIPQIDVKVHTIGEGEGSHIVYYEQPRVAAGLVNSARLLTLQDRFIISNEFLLPEEGRPAGIRERTRAFFKADAYPTLAFDIAIDGPTNLLLAEPLNYDLRILPNTQLTTMTTELPELQLKSFLVTLKSFTQVRTEAALFGATESEDTEKVFTLHGNVTDARSFSKANDYRKTLSTKPLVGLPSTFSTYNIARTYLVDIELVVSCATKDKKCKFRDIPVKVMPPSLEASVLTRNHATAARGSTISGSAAAESSSSTTAAATTMKEMLPGYQPPPGYAARDEAAVEKPMAASSKSPSY